MHTNSKGHKYLISRSNKEISSLLKSKILYAVLSFYFTFLSQFIYLVLDIQQAPSLICRYGKVQLSKIQLLPAKRMNSKIPKPQNPSQPRWHLWKNYKNFTRLYSTKEPFQSVAKNQCRLLLQVNTVQIILSIAVATVKLNSCFFRGYNTSCASD